MNEIVYGDKIDDEVPDSPMMKRIFTTPTYTEEENEWARWFMGEEKPAVKEQKKSA
jgi:hypothetical protein